MYFLVNASPQKPLDVATSNFAVAYRLHDVDCTTFCVTLTPRSRSGQIIYFPINASPP